MTERPAGGLTGWVARGAPSSSSRRAATGGAVGTFAVLVGLLLLLPEPDRSEARIDVVRTREADPAEPRAAMRVHPRTAAELERVLELADDVWSEHIDRTVGVDVVLTPNGRATLDADGIPYEVIVRDVDAVALAEHERLHDPAAQRPGDWFSDYKDAAAITAYAETLAAEHADLAELHPIGTSVEGRPLHALRIRGDGAASDPEPVRLAIDGGLHAREWIAMMVPICVADRLLRGYARDEKLRAFVDGSDLWVVPIANPDGYQHSWDHDRYWRKNRSGEHGVDLNRNFEVAWGERGASDDPRSPIYHGPAPFSEPESAALRDLLRREKIEGHIDFHSYSQLVLYPWSFTAKPTPDRDRLAALAERMAAAIFATHGERYTPKSGASLYPASGTLMDWAYGERDTLSFVVELRPRRGSGFVLPPDQIAPTCDESLAAVMALRDALRPSG
jgi:carboxypeptidase T